MSSRPDRRGQLVVGLLLAVLGFLAVVQLREHDRDENQFAGARRDDLIQLLDSLDAAARRAADQVAELEQARDRLRSATDRREAAIAEAREQLVALGMLAGTVPATGPGIAVTINDPQRSIGTATLLNALQELRDAGAQAVELDDTVRVVAQTAFVDVPDGIRADRTVIRPPYHIEAIGDPHTLSSAMVFPGGLQDEVEELGGSVQIRQLDDVDITSLHRQNPPEYARPAD